jgi:Flp pilus assembly protein TadB
MSSQPARAAGAGELPPTERDLYEVADPLLLRRRANAARVRRRRLLAADLGIGAALALIGLIAAPGLAILALAGLLALALCGLWLSVESLRARRARGTRHHRRRAGRGTLRRRGSS